MIFIKHLRALILVMLTLGGMAGAVHAQKTAEEMVDLAHVPQWGESPEDHDARMQWFRDAKFGMFIHWGPCTVGAREIGWGRDGNRPWDINQHGPRTEDQVYDNYYREFNPVNYDADAWVSFARESGMKYMVLIAKHHDGFSQFDSKVTEYDIMASPYGKDIVREFAEACHKQGMRFGLYYSTRDWYHPDYMQGDNKVYDEFYRAQVEELLSNYGDVDLMWYDHVGGRDWRKWRFDKLFAMMYRLQPDLIVNDRAAKFCGRGAAAIPNVDPVTPELARVCQGDYYTPEGRIGSMDIMHDWESCIHVGRGWSYRGEDGFKSPEKCIKMLSSCTTGGGNLLLNFGPRPDGSFVEAEANVARVMGNWLKTYGEAVYGTRGGPYRNGRWGGSCHKGKKLYLHIHEWPDDHLSLDPLPSKVLSARTLTDAPVTYHQDRSQLLLNVAEGDRDRPVTVVELTLDQAITPGVIIGGTRKAEDPMSKYGNIVSTDATLTMSSANSLHDHEEEHRLLFTEKGAARGYAFHTADELNPWAVIDLGAVRTVNAVLIENRIGEKRTDGLIVSISKDGKTWEQIWKAGTWQPTWMVPVTRFEAGIDIAGRTARHIKMELRDDTPRPLLLRRVTVLGDKETD